MVDRRHRAGLTNLGLLESKICVLALIAEVLVRARGVRANGQLLRSGTQHAANLGKIGRYWSSWCCYFGNI